MEEGGGGGGGTGHIMVLLVSDGVSTSGIQSMNELIHESWSYLTKNPCCFSFENKGARCTYW